MHLKLPELHLKVTKYQETAASADPIQHASAPLQPTGLSHSDQGRWHCCFQLPVNQEYKSFNKLASIALDSESLMGISPLFAPDSCAA